MGLRIHSTVFQGDTRFKILKPTKHWNEIYDLSLPSTIQYHLKFACLVDRLELISILPGDLLCVGLGGIVSLGESGRSLGETTSLARRLYSDTTELCTECASKLLSDPRELHRENISGVSWTYTTTEKILNFWARWKVLIQWGYYPSSSTRPTPC